MGLSYLLIVILIINICSNAAIFDFLFAFDAIFEHL